MFISFQSWIFMYGSLKRFKLFRLQEHIWYLAIKIFSASSANLFTYFPLKLAACHYPNDTLVNDMTLVLTRAARCGRKKTQQIDINVTDLAIVIWLMISWNDHFCFIILIFTEKLYIYNYLNNDDVTFVFLHLKNKFCRPGHLFRTTVLHYNAVLLHMYLYQITVASRNLDIALSFIVVSIILWLILHPWCSQTIHQNNTIQNISLQNM